MTRLDRLLQDSPYQGYAYSYPHKTAYRPLPEPMPLRSLWSREGREALFLYVHVPFCEMRCGFCNLFTQAQPRSGLTENFLAALRREADQVRAALGEVRFARFAIGGGTPTFLDVDQLSQLFDLAERMGVYAGRVPMSVETSPETVDREKLALLKERGVTRVSIGVQSFAEAEVHAVARPQKTDVVESALANLHAADFPVLNIDLIYGLPGQSVASWLASVESALRHAPGEIYLYPLYVRPVTTLGRSEKTWDDERLTCYREARDLLLASGYEQVSMRMFRRQDTAAETGPVYCCQEDGMVGLGCGARSYTRSVHYSREFAVGAQGVRAILADYMARSAEEFSHAGHGFRLNRDEQRRRFVLQSLLQKDGLCRSAYRRRFDSDALDDVPELNELPPRDLGEMTADNVRLTAAGLERSDTIGPWLYSQTVTALMDCYELR